MTIGGPVIPAFRQSQRNLRFLASFFEIKAHRLQSDYFLRPGAQQRLIDRDTSSVVLWSGKLDLTSQINSLVQLKTGMEYIVSDYDIASEVNDACSTRVYTLGNAAALPCIDHVDFESPYRIYESWTAAPHQGAAYLQGKIKLNETLINAGVRLAARFCKLDVYVL